jgi:gamma-glutamylaminecyclotransferase
MPRHYVFVYGTLKFDEPNHHLLLDKGYVDSSTHFVGKGKTVAPFPMVIASKYNIPFVIDQQGQGNRIHGEVYSVTGSTLGRLDEIECHPHYYERRSVQVEVIPVDSSGSSSDSEKPPQIMDCQMYVFHNFDPKLLELPMISSYSSAGDHGLQYIPADRRVAEEIQATKWEVKLPPHLPPPQ